MNAILTSVLERKLVLTPDGKEEQLHSAVDEKEVAFISRLIHEFKCKQTLEVGCAMGVSALAICEAIKQNDPNSFHTIIDPFQSTDWKNIGIYQLQQAGFTNFELIEKPSEFALPKLVQEDFKIDFAFIDGWHTFDHTLLDFFYINRLLKKGGILVVDDVQMPAVKRVMRLIHTYPAYRFIDGVKVNESRNAKALRTVKTLLRPLAKLTGRRIAAELINPSVIQSDKVLGLDASVVAFQKVAEDNRPWNWYENF